MWYLHINEFFLCLSLKKENLNSLSPFLNNRVSS